MSRTTWLFGGLHIEKKLRGPRVSKSRVVNCLYLRNEILCKTKEKALSWEVHFCSPWPEIRLHHIDLLFHCTSAFLPSQSTRSFPLPTGFHFLICHLIVFPLSPASPRQKPIPQTSLLKVIVRVHVAPSIAPPRAAALLLSRCCRHWQSKRTTDGRYTFLQGCRRMLSKGSGARRRDRYDGRHRSRVDHHGHGDKVLDVICLFLDGSMQA